MSEQSLAGVGGANPSGDQDSQEVSSQKQPVPTEDTNVSQDAKTEDREVEAKGDGAEEESPKDEKLDPFHKHPGFQRLVRKNSKLSTELDTMKEQNQQLAEMMKEMLALNKGEEYKPEPSKEDSSIPDAQELLDDEMEQLASSQELTLDQQYEIEQIAKKYPQDLGDGKKVFLAAEQAYAIWKDTQKPVKEPVPTKPSAKVSEKKVADRSTMTKKPQSFQEAKMNALRRLEEFGF